MIQSKHTINVYWQVDREISTRLLPLMETVDNILDVVGAGGCEAEG